MSSIQIDEEETPLRDELVAQYGASVALAYLHMKPLLLENIAISRFIMMKRDPELRMPLPEILTVKEAVAVASMDHVLTANEKTIVGELLQAEYDWQEQMNLASEAEQYSHLISAMDRVSPTRRKSAVIDKIKSGMKNADARLIWNNSATMRANAVDVWDRIPDQKTLLAEAATLPKDKRAWWIGRTCTLELLCMERDALIAAGGNDCTLSVGALEKLTIAQEPVILRYGVLLNQAMELPDV